MRLRFQIPAYNEAPTLGRVVEECLVWGERLAGRARDVSVLILDDASQDETPLIAARLARAEPRVQVSRSTRRAGLGVLFRRGLRDARLADVDVMVHVDGDGQFPLEYVEALVGPVMTDGVDIALASRFLAAELTPRMRWGNRAGNHLFALVVSALCRERFYDVSCGFRAYSRRAIGALELRGEFTYTHEVVLLAKHLGLSLAEVAVPIRGEREHGPSKVAANRLAYGVKAGGIVWETFWRCAGAPRSQRSGSATSAPRPPSIQGRPRAGACSGR